MFSRCILAGLALSLAVAAPAGAATFTAGANGLTFKAAPGVENDISIGDQNVFGDPPRRLVIATTDDPVDYSAQAPLAGGCKDDDADGGDPPAYVINCPGEPTVRFELGDRDDTAKAVGTTHNLTILGETGDDKLSGNDGSQTLLGGEGLDELLGGGDGDVLDGGLHDDYLSGDTGADELRGGPGDETILAHEGEDKVFGDAGDDVVFAGSENDTVEGGEGNDRLEGDNGADTVSGGAGDDILPDEPGADTIRGDAGSDTVFGQDNGEADVYDGGQGFDALDYFSVAAFSVDLVAGVAKGAGPADQAVGFEDLGGGQSGAATLSGTEGANVIAGSSAADVIDPRAGTDIVYAADGDDSVDARDGFADRVSCGGGADTVQADTLDDLAADCETVTRTQVGGPAPAAEDKAPTVAITSPASSAVLSTVAPNTITAEATDDNGIVHVVFSTGERTLCTDTTAPYSCDYVPTSADVGRDTLVAIAVDAAGQTASAVRVVNVPRFKATSLTAATTPKRDRKAPFTFTTKGRLAIPAGVLPAAGCKGTVDVSFKAGKKTVSSRRVALKNDCTYSSKVTFRLPRRLNPKTLSVVVVYGGNEVVEGIQAKRHTVRPR